MSVNNNNIIKKSARLLEDVKAILATNRRSVVGVCTSSAINMWAKNKPVRHEAHWEITDEEREEVAWGLFIDYPNGITEPREVGEYHYQGPTGGEYPYRLLDFNGYYHYADPPMRKSNDLLVFMNTNTQIIVNMSSIEEGAITLNDVCSHPDFLGFRGPDPNNPEGRYLCIVFTPYGDNDNLLYDGEYYWSSEYDISSIQGGNTLDIDLDLTEAFQHVFDHGVNGITEDGKALAQILICDAQHMHYVVDRAETPVPKTQVPSGTMFYPLPYASYEDSTFLIDIIGKRFMYVVCNMYFDTNNKAHYEFYLVSTNYSGTTANISDLNSSLYRAYSNVYISISRIYFYNSSSGGALEYVDLNLTISMQKGMAISAPAICNAEGSNTSAYDALNAKLVNGNNWRYNCNYISYDLSVPGSPDPNTEVVYFHNARTEIGEL